MKKILTTTFFFLLALIVTAQDTLMVTAQDRKTFVTGHGGVNISNMTFDANATPDYKNRTGICAGLGFGFKAGKNILLLAEANYDQKGYRDEITLTDETGQKIGTAHINYYSTYLSVPLIINYTSKGKSTFEAGAGIVNSFLLDAKTISPFAETINQKENYKSYALAYIIRLGGSIKIASQLNLLLEGRISNGLTSFTKSDEVKSIHNTMFVGTGVRYYFNKKKDSEIK